MAEDNTDAQQEAPAPEAASDAAPPARPTRAVDVADDAEPDETLSDRAPRVWLVYNADSGKRYGHIPTQGSGKGGELTPDEVQAYFTRAEYDQATKVDKTYSRARKAELRPTSPYEVATDGES